MAYEATRESLNARPIPGWYEDGKFGIFIHWGLFAVPAYASGMAKISDTLAQNYWNSIPQTPYTEWYANAIKVKGTPSAENHRVFWQDMPYENFRDYFNEGLAQWDPDAWAKLFEESGARYVVFVTKHHDGYCLWPSDVPNPNQTGWTSQRDIVGELAAAVRARGLKFGVYYSGGIDWTFYTRPLRTLGDFIGAVPDGDYPAYADAQMRELIARYKPSVLWNDISWPDDRKSQFDLFAHYYNAIPDGVVNDRWQPAGKFTARLRRSAMARFLFDLVAWASIKIKGAPDGVMPMEQPHSDFRTPEYTSFKTIAKKKWESTRGMSHSFGFNRMDTDKSYDSAEKLIHDFVDAVSKNGNVLLNVGPRGLDAQIPPEQVSRLRAIGAWMAQNGDGLYGTRCWDCAEGSATGANGEKIALRFTAKPHEIFVFFLDTPKPDTPYKLATDATAGFPQLSRITHLQSGAVINFTQSPDGLSLSITDPLPPSPAHGFRLEQAGG